MISALEVRKARVRLPRHGPGFLDKSVRFEGTLECPGTFRVEGEIKGLLISTQTFILGDEARVEGQIEGNHIVISGRFNGDILCHGKSGNSR